MQQSSTATTNRMRQSLSDNPTVARISVIAWIMMLVFSIVQFQFGEWSYFRINTNFISILSPLILMIGTFILIKKERIDLMVFLLGSHLLLLLTNIFLISKGSFNLIIIIRLLMVSTLILTFYYCSRKQKNKNYLTIVSIAFSIIWCLVIFIGYPIVYNIPKNYAFSILFNSSTLQTLAFFIGTAWLGRQTTL